MSFDQIFNQLFDNQGNSTSLATGIRSLDKLIDGGFCDELVLISGRPNHGKSMFLLNMMLNFSYFQEYKGMVVTPRINQKSLTRRMVAIMEDSGAPVEEWEEGVMLDRLSDVKRLFQQKILVDFHFENIEVILTKAIEWKASYLIIDDFFSVVQNVFLV